LKNILADGTIEYRDGNSLHHNNGPAVIHPDGTLEYWLNGLPHRDDGPAFISDILEEYWFHGLCHRIEGPAVKWLKTGKEEYWISDHWLSKEEYEEIFKAKYETTKYNEGPYEVVIKDGIKKYYLAERIHRLDAPAVICNNGTVQHFFAGRLHNIKGPACILAKGLPSYYLCGDKLTFNEWKIWTQEEPIKEVVAGVETYKVRGLLHRLDGPARIKDDLEEWYFRGKLHSVTTAAVNSSDKRMFYLFGKKLPGTVWTELVGL